MLMWLLCVSGRPALSTANINATQVSDDIHVFWELSAGDFTRITLVQCHDPHDEYDACARHDVTNVMSLTVSQRHGEWLTLVVWQDRDDVLSYRISVESAEPTQKSTSERGSAKENGW